MTLWQSKAAEKSAALLVMIVRRPDFDENRDFALGDVGECRPSGRRSEVHKNYRCNAQKHSCVLFGGKLFLVEKVGDEPGENDLGCR